MNTTLVIWDWNGTLLNDVDACIVSMNCMLRKRGMSEIDKEKYKSIFTFPVKKYYEELGFNFQRESFEKLSVEYIALYKKYSAESELQQGAIDLLRYFKQEDYLQIIISASEQEDLLRQVKMRDINSYFDAIIGLDNIHAKSKVENAIGFIKNTREQFDKIIFIGDTYHDLEVAQTVDADCILVQNGHQNMECSDTNGNAIFVDDLTKLHSLFANKRFPLVYS